MSQTKHLKIIDCRAKFSHPNGETLEQEKEINKIIIIVVGNWPFTSGSLSEFPAYFTNLWCVCVCVCGGGGGGGGSEQTLIETCEDYHGRKFAITQ